MQYLSQTSPNAKVNLNVNSFWIVRLSTSDKVVDLRISHVTAPVRSLFPRVPSGWNISGRTLRNQSLKCNKEQTSEIFFFVPFQQHLFKPIHTPLRTNRWKLKITLQLKITQLKRKILFHLHFWVPALSLPCRYPVTRKVGIHTFHTFHHFPPNDA